MKTMGHACWYLESCFSTTYQKNEQMNLKYAAESSVLVEYVQVEAGLIVVVVAAADVEVAVAQAGLVVGVAWLGIVVAADVEIVNFLLNCFTHMLCLLFGHWTSINVPLAGTQIDFIILSDQIMNMMTNNE